MGSILLLQRVSIKTLFLFSFFLNHALRTFANRKLYRAEDPAHCQIIMAADTSKTTSENKSPDVSRNDSGLADTFLFSCGTRGENTQEYNLKTQQSECMFVTAAVVAAFTTKQLTTSSSSEPHDQPEATK